jgi:predicted dehydrogenase
MGGYARHVLTFLRHDANRPDPTVSVTAICDPDVPRFRHEMEELRTAGLSVYANLEELLANPAVQAVWLPVPINLHRRFTIAALDAGKAVMCEKPAAGTVEDVDQMIAARNRTGHTVAIGFQDVYDPLVQDAKRRILAGELGVIQTASVWGVWPRDSQYYSRNTWAGAIRRGNDWVLDSPASNAMAHFITLLLFLLGPTQEQSALPISIEAELYRANPIENYDTCGLRITVEGGTNVLILFTHAGERECQTDAIITGNRGSLTFTGRESMTWALADQPKQHLHRVEPHGEMVRAFAGRTRGDLSCQIATLETARQHVLVINGASQAAAIYDVPAADIDAHPRGDGVVLRAIKGIESLLAQCAAEGKLPHELGTSRWTRPAAKLDLRGYTHFAGPANT